MICNFKEEEQKIEIPEDFLKKEAEVLISNYEDAVLEQNMLLRPYEAVVFI